MTTPLKKAIIKLYINKLVDPKTLSKNPFFRHLASVITIGDAVDVLAEKKQASLFNKKNNNQ